ncbi:MAG: UPF0158 family protein [Opitutaceae bacterium]
MNPPARFRDLTDSLESQSDVDEYAHRFDRTTGRMVMVEESILNAVDDDEEALADLPDWQKGEIEVARAIVADDGMRFIKPPGQFEFHEYRHMQRFIGTVEDEKAADALWDAIKGKGAFRYFKDTLHRFGLQNQWYAFRAAAMKQFVLDWAEANGVVVEDAE